MVWLTETPGCAANYGSNAFQIARFRVREHLYHLRDHGTFKSQTYDCGCNRTERILQAEEQILERVVTPDITTCQLVAEVGVSQFVVHRILKEQGLRPYHVQKVQVLEAAHFPRRVIYCEWSLQLWLNVVDVLTGGFVPFDF